MKRLRLTMRRVSELRVSRTQVSRELIHCVVSDENAGRHIEDAIIGVELLDCLTTAGGVAFAETCWRLRFRSSRILSGIARSVPVDRPWAGARHREIKEDEAVKQRGLAHVDGGEEAHGEMRHEIGRRHES